MKKNKKIIIVLAIILIVIIAVAGLIFVLLNKSTNKRLILSEGVNYSKYTTSKVNYFKDYVYDMQGSSNSLKFPYINIKGMEDINNEIDQMKNTATTNAESNNNVAVSYQSFLNNDILSVSIFASYPDSTISKDIKIYSIDLNTNKKIGYNDIVQKFGLDADRTKYLVEKQIESKIDDYITTNNLTVDATEYKKKSIEDFENDLNSNSVSALVNSDNYLICKIRLKFPNNDNDYLDVISLNINVLKIINIDQGE